MGLKLYNINKPFEPSNINPEHYGENINTITAFTNDVHMDEVIQKQGICIEPNLRKNALEILKSTDCCETNRKREYHIIQINYPETGLTLTQQSNFVTELIELLEGCPHKYNIVLQTNSLQILSDMLEGFVYTVNDGIAILTNSTFAGNLYEIAENISKNNKFGALALKTLNDISKNNPNNYPLSTQLAYINSIGDDFLKHVMMDQRRE